MKARDLFYFILIFFTISLVINLNLSIIFTVKSGFKKTWKMNVIFPQKSKKIKKMFTKYVCFNTWKVNKVSKMGTTI